MVTLLEGKPKLGIKNLKILVEIYISFVNMDSVGLY